MAAPEAAGEKNWEMEKASDTFHPPTTVVATPDPILAQSEPRPPNPTIFYLLVLRIKPKDFKFYFCLNWLIMLRPYKSIVAVASSIRFYC